MASMGQQAIKCSVQSCKFNNRTNACTLSDISVAQEPPANEAKHKSDTICGSFEVEMM